MSDSLPGLRHAARGSFNAMKLCVSALELPCTFDEQIEFLDDVIRTSDHMCVLVDDLSALFEGNPPTTQGPRT